MPAAAPSGTAMAKATITSRAVTATASCTPARPTSSVSIPSTCESGGSKRALTSPRRGSSSQAASPAASRASRVMMIWARVMLRAFSGRALRWFRGQPQTRPGGRGLDRGWHRLELLDEDIGGGGQVLHANEPCHVEGALHPLEFHLPCLGKMLEIAVELARGDAPGNLVDFRDQLDGGGAVGIGGQERNSAVDGGERLLQQLCALLDNHIAGDTAGH